MANDNEYMKVYMANRREARRNKLIEMAGGACNNCGSSDSLEFNHKNRSEKHFGLDKRNMDRSWPKILEEFDKCELLCRPCHEEYTASQYASGEITSWNKGLRNEYIHGTARMYHEKKCRCEKCKLAKKMYRAKLCGQSDVVA